MRIRRDRSLVCQQAVELVTNYLENALSRSERRRFETHIADCPHCEAYLLQIRTTIATLGRVTPDDLSPEAQDDLIELFRAWQAI